MRLPQLLRVINRIETLAELEKIDPVVAGNLKDFIEKVTEYCQSMADQHEVLFNKTMTLSDDASKRHVDDVIESVYSAESISTERSLSRICRDLELIAEEFDKSACEAGLEVSEKSSLLRLVATLHVTPLAFYNAFDELAYRVIGALREGKIGEARTSAREAKAEIRTLLSRVNKASSQIIGSSSDGANLFLTKSQVVENALRRPERVLLLNMSLLIVLFILGATALQYVSLVAFPLLAAFVLASVVVVNAIYLRGIGQLGEESFMGLMKLALLNFFAPLARSSAPARPDTAQGGGES